MGNLKKCMYSKKPRKILFIVLTMVFLTCFISSCFFPEEFAAKITINKDGTYSLVYDGILTFVPAKAAEIQQGKLTSADEREIKKGEQEMLKDPKFKNVKYIGHGQFKVFYKDEGTLNTSIYFINQDQNIVSIVPTNDRKVQIRGMKLDRNDIEQLQKLEMKIDGQLEVTTDAKVIEHNARSAPSFFGLFGSYKWQIKSVNDPAPYMLIQLGETSESTISNEKAEEYDKQGTSQEEMKERILSKARSTLEEKLLHCGESWYGWGGGSGDFRGTLLELKDISIEVKSYELSKADMANRIEWKGLVFIKCDLYRERVGKGWGEWKDGSGGVRIFQVGWNQMIEEPGVINLVIKNGEWHWSNYFSNLEKPGYDCKDLLYDCEKAEEYYSQAESIKGYVDIKISL